MSEFKINTYNQIVKRFDDRSISNRIIIENRTIDLSNLQHAIVFFHACWSGASILIISQIIKELEKYVLRDLELRITDWDQIDLDDFKSKFGETRFGNGNGESVWVEKGEIVYRHYDAADLDRFFNFIEKKFLPIQ